MKRKILLILLLASFCFTPLLYAQALVGDYLVNLGKDYYAVGAYKDALHEFNKALLLNPDHPEAQKYINRVTQEIYGFNQNTATPSVEELDLSASGALVSSGKVTAQAQAREKIIADTMESLSQPLSAAPSQPDYSDFDAPHEPQNKIKLTGEVRSSFGVNSKNDFIWKDANGDYGGVPQEKNWRYFNGEDRHNTFDPQIYDSLKLDLDAAIDSKLGVFCEVVIDPWTFIGKQDVTTTSTAGGDTVDITYKYWSADSRTINEIYRSNKGNIINLRQSKVIDGKTSANTPTGLTDWSTFFNAIPSTEIDMEYRPIRKLWLDYQEEGLFKLHIFPISDQTEALTSDDPLRLSNSRTWWEESAWLDEYEPSRLFSPDSGPQPTKAGKWIKRLSFFSKDSDYNRLTFLRGASFSALDDNLKFTIASPMSLWDNYENADSIESAGRGKFSVADDLDLGFTGTTKFGIADSSLEAKNYCLGVDADWEILSDFHVLSEIAASRTNIYEAIGESNIYSGAAFSLGLAKDKEIFVDDQARNLRVFDLSFKQMEKDFYPGLSSYRYTRRDHPTFGRHITFSGIDPQEDVLGDGLDKGRRVLRLTLENSLFDDKVDYILSNRYVRSDASKFIENASYFGLSSKINDKLSSRLMGWFVGLPETQANKDPLIYVKNAYALSDYFSDTEDLIRNTAITEGENPDIGGGGFGLRYDFNEKLALEGIYERTNDPGDFPRILLTDSYVGTSDLREGILYDNVVPFIYDQNFFDLPPYDYYSIVKSRLLFSPVDRLNCILSFTRNSNRFAAGIDDNINHYGLEMDYAFNDKLDIWAKYIYSQLIDLYRLNKERDIFYEAHHNVFLASKYSIDDSQSLEFLFGEFFGYDAQYAESNWSLSALDTQHLFRFFYRKKF